MNFWEDAVLRFTGWVIVLFGFFGCMGAMFIDEFRGYPWHLGLLQWIGIFIFLTTMLFGVFVTKFLYQVKILLERYLSK